MITAVTADPILIASGNLTNRHRPTTGEHTLLADSTPPAPHSAGTGENGAFPHREEPAVPQPEPERYGAASMFAAAVIAGSMPPVPTTIEELIMRIGTIPVPPESEARIKDLLA